MTIGVTGASGGVGSRVVHHLLTRAKPPRVVALTRRPRSLHCAAQLTARRAAYDDPSSLRKALAGVRTLVFISSDGVAESMRRHHEHVIAAAVEAGVEHVVYTSIVDVSPDSHFYYAKVHRETEALLAESGLDHCLARISIFGDFFVSTWIEPSLEQGTLALPAGTGGMSLLTRDDAARALAVAAVTPPEADQAAAEGGEGSVDLVAALVADEQPFEVMEPGEGALDDPAHAAEAGAVFSLAAGAPRIVPSATRARPPVTFFPRVGSYK